MNKDRLKSHVKWLRGDHEQCNPFLADDIEELMFEHERARVLNEALKAFIEGKPSKSPRTGRQKTTLFP